jgi:hypothetical protein
VKAFWERFIKTSESHFKAGYQEFANPDQFETLLEARSSSGRDGGS